MGFEKTTEQASKHQNLEQKSVGELLQGMHQEDQLAVQAVGRVLHHIEPLITAVVNQQKKGGRLFYIGAGTSGRLGVLDASECPLALKRLWPGRSERWSRRLTQG